MRPSRSQLPSHRALGHEIDGPRLGKLSGKLLDGERIFHVVIHIFRLVLSRERFVKRLASQLREHARIADVRGSDGYHALLPAFRLPLMVERRTPAVYRRVPLPVPTGQNPGNTLKIHILTFLSPKAPIYRRD